MQKYDTIFWDVDGTLLDFDKSEVYALTKCFLDFRLEMTPFIYELYRGINHSLWKKMELGEVNKNEVLVGRFVTLFSKLGIKQIDPLQFQEAFRLELSNVFYYIDDSLALFKKYRKICRQYLVTNGTKIVQEKKLINAQFYSLADGVFISEDIGFLKPNIEFFDFCEANIPLFSKESTIIVGDSLTSDIKGGNNFQIATCWYNPKNLVNESNAIPTYEIQNLWEIKKIIGE